MIDDDWSVFFFFLGGVVLSSSLTCYLMIFDE